MTKDIIVLQKIVFPCGVILIGKMMVDRFGDVECPLHTKICYKGIGKKHEIIKHIKKY